MIPHARSYAAAALLCGGFFGSTAARPGPANATVPVLVELFTSEGCSSCPPADALLKALSEARPLPGVQLIPLEFHVDYWNSLGWTDPFSKAEFTTRQSEYVRTMGLRGGYTPQMVVNGRSEFVGSDERAARAAIAEAARMALPVITLTRLPDTPAGLRVRATPPEGGAGILYAALSETGLASAVARGENGGRTLRHAAVVRSFISLRAAAGAPAELTLPLPAGDVPAHLAVAVWLQPAPGGPVTALGFLPSAGG